MWLFEVSTNCKVRVLLCLQKRTNSVPARPLSLVNKEFALFALFFKEILLSGVFLKKFQDEVVAVQCSQG